MTTPCIFLNLHTNLCSIYEDRFKINPLCLSIEQAIEQGALPKECLYIINNKKYQKRLDVKKR